MAKILTRLRIDEVSSVDRGAGEGVKIMLMKRENDEPYWKREFTREQRDRDAKSGAAESDGSFPIHNASDLHNAMRAVGRSKNPEKTKNHIRARARALGLTGQLSDSFKRNEMSKLSNLFSKLLGGDNKNEAIIDKSVEGLAASVTSILGDEEADDVAKTAALTKSFEQFGEHLKETLTAGPAVIEKKEGSEMNIQALAKALGLAVETATEAEVTAAFTKSMELVTKSVEEIKKLRMENAIYKADFTHTELAFYNKMSEYDSEESDEEGDGDPKGKGKPSKKKSFRLASHAERAEIMKAAEPALPAHIQKIMDDNAALAKRIAELEGGTAMTEYAKRATEYGLADSEAMTLSKAYRGDKEAVDKLLGFIKAAQAQAKAGGVFKELGSRTGDPLGNSSAVEQLNELAKRLAEKENISFSKAFAKVYENPNNAELVKRERDENRPRAA